MRIRVKRAYEKPSRTDGTRVLVDRLWPRGVTKAGARIDLWFKDLAPSTALRRWFHADPERRFAQFQKRYRGELARAKRPTLPRRGTVTLVTAARDLERSHVPAIRDFLSHG